MNNELNQILGELLGTEDGNPPCNPDTTCPHTGSHMGNSMGDCMGCEDIAESVRRELGGFPLAMVYSPKQYFRQVMDPETALRHGTMFAELDLPLEVVEGGKK